MTEEILNKSEEIITEYEDEIIELYGEDYTTDDVLEFASNEDLLDKQIYNFWIGHGNV